MYQVFVVEDELLIRQSIRNVIENMPGPFAFCGEASDGEMALSMMQDLMPDIVLTDIRMPFLDGFELIRHAKAMMPWLKIIIISGFGEFESAQKAISLGVDQYLLKPIRPPELTKAIEEMARRIEADKQHSAAHGYDHDEVQHALRQHFMQQLLYGGLHTSTLLERAHALKLDVVSPCYQPVLFRLGQLALTAAFWKATAFSLLRVLAGSLLAVLLATLLAVLCCRWKVADALFAPFVTVVKSTPVASFIVLLVLWILVVITMWKFDGLDTLAGTLLLPYLLWITFAGYLNLGVYLLN